MSKTKTTDSLPTNLSDALAVQAATATLQQAEQQRHLAAAELDDLADQLEGMDSETGLTELATRALDGAALSDLCGDGVRLVGQLADCRMKLKIAQRAEQLAAEKLRAAMADEFEKAVPLVRGAYAAAVTKLAGLLVQLRKASLEEAAIRTTYERGSLKMFSNRIPYMTLPVDVERIKRWLADASAAGLLDSSVVAQFEATVPATSRW